MYAGVGMVRSHFPSGILKRVRLLEADGNISPRGMVATPLNESSIGEQNSAYFQLVIFRRAIGFLKLIALFVFICKKYFIFYLTS